MLRVSVVIPIYNVESYLALSLESVRRQTYDNIEVICVNDGSTDSSAEIAALFVRADRRFILIDKENGGLSSARNAGIARATGDIICFLDSDDLLEPEACATLAKAFAETRAEVVTYGAHIYPSFHEDPWLSDILSPRDIVYDGFDPAILYVEKSRPFAWRTACKREFLARTGVLFDESIVFGEDQVFHFAVYPRSRRTAFISNKLVKYRVAREGSLMFTRSQDVNRRLRDHIAIIDCIGEDWASEGYFGQNASSLFDWTFDFVVPDIVSCSGSDREDLQLLLAESWKRIFAKELIEEKKESPTHGRLVSEILEGGTSSGKILLLRFSMAHEGKRATLRKISRRMRSLFARDLSMVSVDEKHKWEAADRLEVNRAFAEIKKEAPLPIEGAARKPAFEGDPVVSVIIPVYNADHYLAQCLTSVLSQTERQIEVLCIDDGSTDKSSLILNDFVARDSRVVVLSQNNLGGGAARNTALDIARGEFVAFLDADDWAEPNMLEMLVGRARETSADMVVSAAWEYDNVTGDERIADWIFRANMCPNSEVFSYRDMPDDIFGAFPSLVWNKLFRRSFVEQHHLRFQEIYRTNDLYFANCAAVMAERIAVVDSAFVHHRVGTTDNCQATNERDPLGFYEAFRALGDFLKEKGIYEIVERSYLDRALDGLVSNLASIKTQRAFLEICSCFYDEMDEYFGFSRHCEVGYFRDWRQYELYLALRNSSLDTCIFAWSRALLAQRNSIQQEVYSLWWKLEGRDERIALLEKRLSEDS